MIEQTAKDCVKQAYRDGKKPSFCAVENELKRGMIWQTMEECRYNQKGRFFKHSASWQSALSAIFGGVLLGKEVAERQQTV